MTVEHGSEVAAVGDEGDLDDTGADTQRGPARIVFQGEGFAPHKKMRRVEVIGAILKSAVGKILREDPWVRDRAAAA